MEYIITSKLTRLGTSLAIVIPKKILTALKMGRGDQVIFGIYDENTIIIKKIPDKELRNFKNDIQI
jgi:bifunctional DNA-binding transcriptional regulator/antitoxin component of YhaV-PrlF toxin-antitoxin module